MMERALKERIIGAVVLVVFVVLVVPIFLDGPPDNGEVVTERVLLPGQDGAKTQTVVLDRDRTEPVPVASSGDEAAQPAAAEPDPEPEAESPVVAKQDPVRRPEKVSPQPEAEKPAEKPATASTTGMWAVQLGSFSNKDNAEKLAADLRKQGYAAFLSQLETGSGTLHRVRIGPQKDRESAEAMAARLLKVDIKGQVVPHP
jgi:DedD protein